MLASINYSQRLMNQSSVYFPVIGLLLGGLYVGLYHTLTMLWPPTVVIIVVLCFHLWLTGAFHEDGLADSVDALGGANTVERRLTIMKDSRIGTYGSVALIGALALKAALLLSLELVWLGLLVGPCMARLTPLILMRYQRYITAQDTSKTKPVADSFSTQRLIVASLFVLVVSLITHTLVGTLIAVILVSVIWGATLQRTLGGYTGDTLGASVIFTELLFLLALAANV